VPRRRLVTSGNESARDVRLNHVFPDEKSGYGLEGEADAPDFYLKFG
jgi:hypothetical protein